MMNSRESVNEALFRDEEKVESKYDGNLTNGIRSTILIDDS